MKDKSKRLTVVNTDKKKADENASHMLQQKPASALNAAGFNPALYLLKSVWDSVFEIKTDVSGQKYIFGKLPVVTKYGITMYADDGNVDIPQLAEGLPFDQKTIWFNPETEQIEVLGGTGGGEGGVSNFWDLSGIPSWITNSKPIYNYNEIKNTPDLSVFVTGTALSNTLADYATLSYLTGELKKYVTIKDDQDIVGVKDFLNGIKISHMPIRKLQDDVIYIDANLVVRGGVTMYSTNEADIPTIKDEIGFAGYNGSIGLASFDSSQFVISANGTVSVKGGSTGLDTAQLKEYLDNNKYTTETWVKAQGYASASSLSSLQTKVNNFLEGSDTDTIINKWKELEVFLSGLSESDNLATILSTKWTTDNSLINQWNTAYGWGNHASVGYALKSYVDSNFVTLGTKQTITGEKNFTGGLRVNNSPSIYYDATNKYWKLEGDLLVTGGVTMYGTDEGDIPSTPSSVSILGDLQDVSSFVSGTTNSDVVLFKSANTSTWTTKPLSEIGGGNIDLSGYLKKSGGAMTGQFSIMAVNSTSGPNIYYTGVTGTAFGRIGFSGVDMPYIWKADATGGYDILHSGNYSSYALPLSGGTIKSNTATPLVLSGTSMYTILGFSNNALVSKALVGWMNEYTDRGDFTFIGNQSSVGVISVNNTGCYYSNTWDKFNQNVILHSGNYSSYALPLSGGTLSNKLNIHNTAYVRNLIDLYSPYTDGAYITCRDESRTVNVGLGARGALLDYYNGSVSSSLTLNQESITLDTNGGANTYTLLHSGNISSYNAGSATKLQTARTIWGQSFDGTGNVSGTIKCDLIRTLNNVWVYGYEVSNNTISFGSANVGQNTEINGGSVTISSWNSSTRAGYIKIANNGNVGIGITSPSVKLDVNGRFLSTHSVSSSDWVSDTAQIRANATGTKYYIGVAVTTGGQAVIQGGNSGTGSIPLLLNPNGGNVGIGTANPTHALEIYGEFYVRNKTFDYAIAYFGDYGYIDNYSPVAGRSIRMVAQTSNGTTYGMIGLTTSAVPYFAKKEGIEYVQPLMYLSGGSTVSASYKDEWSLVFGKGDSSVWMCHQAGYGMYLGSTSSSSNVYLLSLNSGQTSLGSGGFNAMIVYANGNMKVGGGITMYSDIRKKTKLQDVELSLSQIANAPLIQHYYNSDQDKTTHVGSIAQYWAGMNDWFCKLDSEGYYTMEIQNCALASAISIARELVKYESKTDKTIRKMKQRIEELENEVERLKNN